MKKRIIAVSTGMAAASLLTVGTLGIVSADSTTQAASTTTSTTNSVAVPRTVLHTQRLAAEAQVLKTTPAAVQSAKKGHTLSQLIKAAGMTRASYRQAVHSLVVSNLQALGYTQSQITAATTHNETRRHNKGSETASN